MGARNKLPGNAPAFGSAGRREVTEFCFANSGFRRCRPSDRLALPVLRNALPGAPPLGVRADMFVFLWTELAAVIALGFVVFSWARTSPRS
jgi:Domain of unknown function (DUF4436)